jgi:hypothetical protein|tara:strand:+ start:1488 stop:1826 length:339 start_codon:yes stop_codon:yes gene_type:complete
MKRTRRIQARFVKAKKQTETIVRCNAGIKGADAYRLLKLWHEEKIANCVNADTNMYSIPRREYFYKWYESAMKNADLNYELKRILKHGKRNAEIELINNKLVITIDLQEMNK